MASQCQGAGGPTAPYCDVGSGLAAGEYLFDFRAANVSVNGVTLAEWFVEQYFFNASDGANHDIVSGFCECQAGYVAICLPVAANASCVTFSAHANRYR